MADGVAYLSLIHQIDRNFEPRPGISFAPPTRLTLETTIAHQQAILSPDSTVITPCPFYMLPILSYTARHTAVVEDRWRWKEEMRIDEASQLRFKGRFWIQGPTSSD